MWYHIEKKVKTWALRQFERRTSGAVLTPDDVDWTDVHRVLIVRQHDQFGDFLLTTPAIRALRHRFPQAFITLVVRDYLYPIAQGNPDVDEVVVFHESAWRWRPRTGVGFVRRMREAYDLAVVFNTVSHSLSSDMIACLSRAPLVLGPASPVFDGCSGNPFYTLVAPVDAHPKHQVYRNLDVTRYIGACTNDLTYGFRLSSEEMASGAGYLQPFKDRHTRRYIGVHFGTKDVKKRYPIEKLAGLCDRLSERDDTRIIVIRAPDEDELLAALQQRLRRPVGVAPSLGLRHVAAFLNGLDLVICNDTGVLHLAAAVGTPTVSMHTISDPALWKPIGRRHISLYATSGDMAAIPVDRALEAVDRAMSERDETGNGIEETILRC